jgi:hypothetical protein
MNYLSFVLLINIFIMNQATVHGMGRPARRGRVLRNRTEIRNRAHNEYTRRIPQEEVLPSFRRPLHNELTVLSHNLGLMNHTCMHCDALHFAEEVSNGHFNSCCHNGLINLPQPQVNEELKELFLHDTNFVKHIRQYNSAMAFASLSASQKEIQGRGPYCFKIQGQIY